MNTHSPKVSPMTRVLLVVLLCALAAGCSGGPGSEPGGPRNAETFKTEMDAEAKALLPDLMVGVGGELNGMQATFYERSGFGIWDYDASGSITDPTGSVKRSLVAATQVLKDHGYTTENDQDSKRVTARKRRLIVTIEASVLTGQSNGLNLSMGSLDTMSEDDDFAENAPPEDYLAYLE